MCSGTGAQTKLARCRSSLARKAALTTRIWAGEGSLSALGSSGQRATAVSTETAPVAALIRASTP
jgi:hypothetical protein